MSRGSLARLEVSGVQICTDLHGFAPLGAVLGASATFGTWPSREWGGERRESKSRTDVGRTCGASAKPVRPPPPAAKCVRAMLMFPQEKTARRFRHRNARSKVCHERRNGNPFPEPRPQPRFAKVFEHSCSTCQQKGRQQKKAAAQVLSRGLVVPVPLRIVTHSCA